jgi:predicted HTH transcriptional regulator
MTVPTDEELLLSLKNFEDNFVERKTVSDSRDWLKTAVAFANSVPVGYPAVMFVGVKNDGTVQPAPVNLETLQRSVSEEINKAYPSIYHLHGVLRDPSGSPFLAVIIPGSGERPHFSGQAYIRVGSDSKPTSEVQFQNLIAQRQSKAYEILKWKGQIVSVDIYQSVKHPLIPAIASSPQMLVVDCNPHYVTLGQGPNDNQSFPLRQIEISHDHQRNRLKLEIHPI